LQTLTRLVEHQLGKTDLAIEERAEKGDNIILAVDFAGECVTTCLSTVAIYILSCKWHWMQRSRVLSE